MRGGMRNMDTYTPEFTAVIADDEPSVLSGLQNSVDWASLGVSIIAVARDGRQALNLIITHQPDIAIIDIKMPEMNGLEVIHGVREAGVSTDFIILSGYDEFSYAKDAIRYGAKAYLLKPLNKKELHDELYRICSQRPHAQPLSADSESEFHADSLGISFFSDLIDGKLLDSGKASQILRSSQSRLTSDSCYVMVFLFSPDPSEFPEGLPFRQIISRLDTQFSGKGHKFWQYDDQKLIGIFNSSGSFPEQTAKQCLEILSLEQLPAPIIGIGDTVSRLLECSYSYNRALTALSYRLYDERLDILSWNLICTVPPQLKLTDIDYLSLIQYIVKKDAGGIEAYCGNFVDSLLYVPMPPPNYVFSMCYALFNQISREFSSFTYQDIPETANPRELYKCATLSRIKEWLTASFCRLSEFVDAVYGYSGDTPLTGDAPLNLREMAEEPKDNIIRDAMAYVKEHINQHIKLKDIADHVLLSPSYFAIYFKSKTNINLRDYLLKEKMEYAKRRLTDPNVSISDVAFDIGYGDYRSFSRAFKNIYGITPSDFQNKQK